MLSKVTQFGKVLLLAILSSQLMFWNFKNCTRGESTSPETSTGGTTTPIACPANHYREWCPEDMPCCFFDGKNHTCRRAQKEGERCTLNSLGYNTEACFCKEGLFCIENECTSTKPERRNSVVYSPMMKK
ncbi:uncharacterized protein CDAR_593341 [Caerostris darwini]|uniref:Uncharacterized protein n=1 Tax=Caerostris darwini TaxID=1538125 RepID=A0AAV4UW32_9ARAC|nr:uncharacterized protein CDAR_593341 [Caerostris darwini]